MIFHSRPKKVVLDARLNPGANPGIQTLIEGFIQGLNELSIEGYELYWITTEDNSWLLKNLKNKKRVITDSARHIDEIPIEKVPLFPKRLHHQNSFLNQIDHRLLRDPLCLDSINPDLVHFFSQDAFVTKYKSIYHPHDLQHLHFPENFSNAQLDWRGSAWPVFAKLASSIVVGSDHVADDLENFWKIPRDKISKIDLRTHIIDFSTQAHEKKANNVHRIIEGDYIIYPAAYYAHKNHLNLLRAVALLRGEGFHFKVVLTGGVISEESEINRLMRDLNLQGQVIQLGYIERRYLIDLIKLSKMVVVPSMYESRSFPVEEGIASRVPVIASDIPGIKEQFHNPEFLFNPTDPTDIAEKIKKVFKMNDKERTLVTDKNLTSASKRNWSDVATDYLTLWKNVIWLKS